MNKFYRGASLAQYCIVISLIALAIVPVYFICGQQIKSTLEKYLSGYQIMNNNISLNASGVSDALINGRLKPGQLGGKTDNPVRECFDNVCAIDYGNIVVNGIPTNYPDLIETSGASGGTEKILSIMDNLLKQMEENPDEFTPDEVAKIKGLIAKGKDIVNLEKYFQDRVLPASPDIMRSLSMINSQSFTLQGAFSSYVAQNPVTCSNEMSTACQSGFRNSPAATYNMGNITSNAAHLIDIRGFLTNSNINQYQSSDNVQVPLTLSSVMSLLDPSTTLSYSIRSDGSKTLNGVSSTSSSSQINPNTLPSMDDYITGTASLRATPSDTCPQGRTTCTIQQLSPLGVYLNELKTLNQDDTYDSNLKQVANILSKEIYDLSQHVRVQTSRFSSVLTNTSAFYPNYISTSSNPTISQINSSMNTTMAASQKPSERTRLDLGIICTSNRGEFNKDNVTCESQNK